MFFFFVCVCVSVCVSVCLCDSRSSFQATFQWLPGELEVGRQVSLTKKQKAEAVLAKTCSQYFTTRMQVHLVFRFKVSVMWFKWKEQGQTLVIVECSQSSHRNIQQPKHQAY